MAGVAAGLEIACQAVRVSLRQTHPEDLTRKFLQLADDWAVILTERIQSGQDWTDVMEELQRMRLQNCLERLDLFGGDDE
jgi:hypothetical protein